MGSNGFEGNGAERIAAIRRYRRLMWVAIGVGVLGFLGLDELGYPFAGLAVYWAGVIAFAGIWKGTSVQLFDERDAALERRTSHATLKLVGGLGLLAFTTLVVLGETTVEVPDLVWGAYLGYSALFLLWGGVYTVLRYR
jgi:hypothetical protein